MDLRSHKADDTEKVLKRKKNTEKLRKWREKQRLNPDKNEELKKRDRERKCLERLNQRKDAEKSKSKLETLRKKKRDEMRQYRSKKREKMEKLDKKKEQTDKTKTSRTLKKQLAMKRTQTWRLRVKLEEHADVEVKTCPSSSFSSRFAR